MKPKHHLWSSLAAGGVLYWATGSGAALVGSVAGGFLIDSDHFIDQLWSIRHGAPFRRELPAVGDRTAGSGRAWFNNYLRPRKLLRLPLIFHSYELLSVIILLTLILKTPFMIGLASGYVLHVALDLIRHHHEFRSPLFYLFLYRMLHGFRRDRLIKPQYL